MKLKAQTLGRGDVVGEKGWSEMLDENGQARPAYRRLLERVQQLRPADLRRQAERMQASMREMGVTFDTLRHRASGEEPWFCDLLPHVFEPAEWKLLTRGFQQRLRAFELFLRDIHGPKDILRRDVLPIAAVLGSQHFQRAVVGYHPPDGAFLHLNGICVARGMDGEWLVKSHSFGQASGLAHMMQNRRMLARATPEIFHDMPIASIAETPLLILEKLRELSRNRTGTTRVVLLSGGIGAAGFSEHGFLARRMGIPLVQGGDLLVLDDRVYLKTVGGLEQVDVIYSRIGDAFLDPLVFRKDSRLGVPGLVHCLRKGTVVVVNSPGSQIADDRALLPFAAKIIRFYLDETPILPSVPTLWCGDLDQREMVFERWDQFHIRPLVGERVLFGVNGQHAAAAEAFRTEVRRNPEAFIAQPTLVGGRALCVSDGKQSERWQDHLLIALRRSEGNFDVFPGALTRVSTEANSLTEAEFGAGTKDTWVLQDEGDETGDAVTISTRSIEEGSPTRQVTSRVAEAFYWMGRYFERAHSVAYMIAVIETLEMEELNGAERKLYRPMWNRLLPPLETPGAAGRRSITSRIERYRLVLQPEPGSVVCTLQRAIENAGSIQESLSPEAWATITELRERFSRQRFKPEQDESLCGRVARRMSDYVTRLVPQFFGVAQSSVLADDGWRFCELGQLIERAVITANAVVAISAPLREQLTRPAHLEHATEIELSAFLRLLGTRDAYRRVYQMRAEPLQVLEVLWNNCEAPRSVSYCLRRCAEILRASASAEAPGSASALEAIEQLLQKISGISWRRYFNAQRTSQDEDAEIERPNEKVVMPLSSQLQHEQLSATLSDLMRGTLDIHHVVADGFLNHQAQISPVAQPLFEGF